VSGSPIVTIPTVRRQWLRLSSTVMKPSVIINMIVKADQLPAASVSMMMPINRHWLMMDWDGLPVPSGRKPQVLHLICSLPVIPILTIVMIVPIPPMSWPQSAMVI